MPASVLPYKPAAYQLFHEGLIALAGVEANGLRIDVEYLDSAIDECATKISDLTKELQGSKVVKIWKKHFGPKYSPNSNDQLAEVLFEVIGHDCPVLTEKGNYTTTEKTLAMVDEPFCKGYIEKRKWIKAKNSYLRNIKIHTVNGWCRPSFNLHLADTFRSSCDAPSFQNIPIRIPWVSKLIRRCFIAEDDCVLIEIDFSGTEVRIAACYHKDPTMLDYLEDKSKDMHRDTAVQIYGLPDDLFDKTKKSGDEEAMKKLKAIRHCAKNMFVFPEFYGSVWFQTAPELWNACKQMNLELPDGTSLRKHLKRQGITELGTCEAGSDAENGTFAAHVQEMERDFWENRFPVYSEWKREWYALYKKRGWMRTKNGFILQGYLKRNQVINYPVQGPAFHCLLWSLIELQLRELPKRLPKVKLVGQIHDSMLFNVPKNMVDDLIRLAEKVMTVKLRKAWPWIITPMEIEADVTPVGGSWFDKKEYKVADD